MERNLERRIGILQFARLNSKRVPQKLLQQVGGERLIDRGLRYLRRLHEATGAEAVICCPPEDRELIDIAAAAGVGNIPDQATAKSPEQHDPLFAQLVAPLAERFDIVWDANVFCRPFLRLSLGVEIIHRCQTTIGPFVLTTESRGIVWNRFGVLISGHGELANTKTNPTYQTLAHLGYGLPASCLGQSEVILSGRCKPSPIAQDWLDRIDIDTPDDLEFARAVADLKGLYDR